MHGWGETKKMRDNSTRVLFINSPYPFDEHPTPPLSLSYLGAVLLREGIEVEVLDLLMSHYSASKVKQKLKEYRPQVVGTSCATMSYTTASRVLKVCKGFDPGVVTVIGGPHVSFTAEETLERAPWIDIVVRGEGEETLVALIRALEGRANLRGVEGIAFREDGAIVLSEPRPPIEDLNALPLPARHLLPLSKYRALGVPAVMLSSRGCPFRCIFCSAPKMFGRRVRFRDPKLVVDEIEMLHKELGFKEIHFVDDTFTLNPRHAKAICNEIMARNLHIDWHAYSRVDTIDQDLLRLMRKAGCYYICFGIESGSQQVLDTIKKGITLEEAKKVVRLAAEAGMGMLLSFILGLPGETPETARQTVALAKEFRDKYGAKYGFHLLAPLPGTEMREKADEYGVKILTNNWARYDANKPITETANMSAEAVTEIIANYDRAVACAWEEMKCLAEAGDPLQREAVGKKLSQGFVWRLIKDDVIERLGRIKADDAQKPVEQLSLKVAQRLAVPLDVAQQEMARLVGQGLIKSELVNGGFVWKWS